MSQAKSVSLYFLVTKHAKRIQITSNLLESVWSEFVKVALFKVLRVGRSLLRLCVGLDLSWLCLVAVCLGCVWSQFVKIACGSQFVEVVFGRSVLRFCLVAVC